MDVYQGRIVGISGRSEFGICVLVAIVWGDGVCFCSLWVWLVWRCLLCVWHELWGLSVVGRYEVLRRWELCNRLACNTAKTRN